MTKTVELAFTGVACVTPAFVDKDIVDVDENEVDVGKKAMEGPLQVVLPNSRRSRLGLDANTNIQVDAHFTAACFASAQLVPESPRQADYRFAAPGRDAKGLCFFDREILELVPAPDTTKVRYRRVGGETGAIPSPGFRDAKWIASWDTFASGGNARFKPGVLTSPGEYVRVDLPGGEISSEFTSPLMPRVKFLYGETDKEHEGHFAHLVVVTLEYPEETPKVTLRSVVTDDATAAVTTSAKKPGKGRSAAVSSEAAVSSAERETVERSNDLEFRWESEDTIRITIVNGALESIDSLLRGDTGRQHRAGVDHEFGLLYDVIDCERDQQDPQRWPLPDVQGDETRPVPCLTSIIKRS